MGVVWHCSQRATNCFYPSLQSPSEWSVELVEELHSSSSDGRPKNLSCYRNTHHCYRLKPYFELVAYWNNKTMEMNLYLPGWFPFPFQIQSEWQWSSGTLAVYYVKRQRHKTPFFLHRQLWERRILQLTIYCSNRQTILDKMSLANPFWSWNIDNRGWRSSLAVRSIRPVNGRLLDSNPEPTRYKYVVLPLSKAINPNCSRININNGWSPGCDHTLRVSQGSRMCKINK
jgi:hypothetical protein